MHNVDIFSHRRSKKVSVGCPLFNIHLRARWAQDGRQHFDEWCRRRRRRRKRRRKRKSVPSFSLEGGGGIEGGGGGRRRENKKRGAGRGKVRWGESRERRSKRRRVAVFKHLYFASSVFPLPRKEPARGGLPLAPPSV